MRVALLTWPKSWKELPVFDPGVPNPVNMDYYLGYRYYDKKNIKPLYPFGHGLTYTTFAYDNLEVPCDHNMCGVSVFVQVIQVDPGAAPAGLSFTPGLELVYGH